MNRKDSRFFSAARFASVLIFTTIFSAHAFAEDAQNAKPEPSKAKQEQDLSARILDLQGTKDCIKNANTREAVANCQKSIKLRAPEKK